MNKNSQVTKQGIRNLNDIGPKKKRDRRDDFGLCLTGFHDPGLWEQAEDDNFQIQRCSRCDAVLASNNPNEDADE